MKVLVEIAHCGLLLYISPVYGEQASDNAIFNQSNILNRFKLIRDFIMVDKGFDIELQCIKIKLN